MNETEQHRIAKKIAVKSAELLESFQWSAQQEDRAAALKTIADLDVLIQELREQLTAK